MGRTELAARRPHGGFRLISVTELFAAWWAYGQGRLEFRDLRVYFALHEVVSRRCIIRKGVNARYTLTELAQLTGVTGNRGLASSLRRLSDVGLSTWNPNSISFNDVSGLWTAQDETFAATLERIANRRRKVPVPRRTIRFIARAKRPVLVATILGHLLRCVYAKRTLVASEGSISAVWVARVFGVDPRNVKRAKAQLRAIGWLIPEPSDHWHRQRYGGRVSVNLAWGPGTSPKAAPRRRLPLGEDKKRTHLPPPDSNRELPKGIQNQNTALTGRSGLRNRKDPTPSLQNVRSEDLENAGRLLSLFQQAQMQGIVGSSEHERLQFVGAAIRALRKASNNTGGFFLRMIRDKLWHHLTADEEDGARRMLNNHLFSGGRSAAATCHAPSVKQSSDADVRLVAYLHHSFSEHGYDADPCEVLCQKDPRWTRERWDRAMRAWLNPLGNSPDDIRSENRGPTRSRRIRVAQPQGMYLQSLARWTSQDHS